MENNENIIFLEKPQLRKPYLICGQTGWVDGGGAATGTIKYLSRKLNARKFASLPIDNYHLFQVPGQTSTRPDVSIENGILKEHRLPTNDFLYCTAGDYDLILLLGTEPNMNWQGYADNILQLAEEFEVSRIYMLGGVMDKTPHTREPNVSCLSSSKTIKKEMSKYGMQYTNYEGPGSYGTFLMQNCMDQGVEMVNLMVRATYYPEFNILIPYNPKSIRAIVKRLKGILNLDIDTSDLDTQVTEFEGKLNFMVSQNPEFRTYLTSLEKEYVEIKYQEPLDISADEAVQIAEELLKNKKDRD